VALIDSRAKRYVVALPVRYRLAGSDICDAGWTENISVSGLLFTTAVMLEVGTKLEVWVQITAGANGGNRSMLYCQVSVVRQAWCDGSRPAAAVRISRFRVLPAVPDFTTVPATLQEERL
jgi:hypothetical protein